MHKEKLTVLIVLSLFLLGCGGGISDDYTYIEGQYYYLNAGEPEKMIVRRSKDGLDEIVIDARVDRYIVKEGKIFIARRPRSVSVINNVAETNLSSACEYWAIDPITSHVERVSVLSKEAVEVECL
ncbi:hypothetical protein ACJJIC_16535 [Microbulbifer sp. ANSA002]|uniref:hypothetical protein n=1 Tax=unclassified Microbulbifer TaxID=2619833 RepID=UPI0040432C98